MYNEIKCAIQYTVDLINNNINRDVQEECANRLYRVCTHYIESCQVKSSHLYLYSAFNNTNCNKALHNIKIGKFCQ